MANYTTNKKISQLTIETTIDSGDYHVFGDVSETPVSKAKAITHANLVTELESVIDLGNLQGQIDLTTQVTGQLPAANINISDLTANSTFQTAVNNFVSGGSGGASSSGKPMTFAITSAGSGTLNPTTGYQDREAYIFDSGGVNFYLQDATGYIQTRDISVDWAAADITSGHALIGNDLYILLRNTGGSPEARIYKYDASDLSLGGVQMTISGITLTYNTNLLMTSNGTKLYVNFAAGTTANANEIAGFTVSGTTATYVSTVTCGASGTPFTNTFAVTGAENYYGLNAGVLTQYDNTGTLTYTSDSSGANGAIINWDDTLYVGESDNGLCIKLFLPDTEVITTGTQTRTVNISSAQILALHTTPVQLVPAQGANTVVVVTNAVFSLDVGVAYAGGTSVEVNYGGSTTALILANSNMQDATDSVTLCPTNDAALDITPGVNQPVELKNNGSAFTTGTGTLKVFVTYKVITL